MGALPTGRAPIGAAPLKCSHCKALKCETEYARKKSNIPEGKKTALGLYLTAKEAYEKWKAAPDKSNIIDGMEGDGNGDSESAVQGGWKNSGCPWTKKLTTERMVLPKAD